MLSTRTFAFTATGRTDLGRPLEPDQDVFVLRPDLGLFVLADGVAEFPAGDVAAAIAAAAIESCIATPASAWPSLPPRTTEELAERLGAAVRHANTRVFDAGSRDPRLLGMGATVVAILVLDDVVCMAHLGDSRIHRIRDAEGLQLTDDHSLALGLIAEGMAPHAVQAFQGDIALKRTLGTTPLVHVAGHLVRARPGDTLLLTSDAFHAMSPEDLAASLSDVNDLDAALDRLFADAAARAGAANRTAVLLRWPR